MRQMVNKKSKNIVMLCSFADPRLDRFQFEFANGAASSSERINLMMRRRITADIQRSQLGFTLSLTTAMAFSIRRVAPSPGWHILFHQSTAMAFSIRRV